MSDKITIDQCLDFLGIESTPEINDMVASMVDGIYSSLYVSTGYDQDKTYISKVENLANTIVKLELYNDFNNQNIRTDRISYLIKQLQVMMCADGIEVNTEA